jgi:D-galactose 1-dehydrogenase
VTRSREPIAIGIVGFGKIARDRHVAAIRDGGAFLLHSIADLADIAAPAPRYPSVERMLAADDAPAAVAICTPPQARFAAARHALARGKHVLLEKPPAVTLGELEELRALADGSRVTLFCAWHSQFAPAVAPARDWLATRTLRRVRIDWREDVRVWHPGQRWIFQPGGFGIFDPGINALSVAAKILPKRLLVRDALLKFPGNCAAPIAAELALTDADATPMTASFDFLQTGPPTWEIAVETATGALLLSQGGSRLTIEGHDVPLGPRAEYPALYAHFAGLIADRRSDVDATPLNLVADAFLRGRHETAPEFVDPAADAARSSSDESLLS